MMNVSTNELQTLVVKACRGIGLPIAQAQEAAAAIAVSPQAITDFLESLDTPMRKASFVFTAGLEVKNAHILRDFPICADAAQQNVELVIIRDIRICELILALARYRGVSVKARSNDLLLSKDVKYEKLPERYDLDIKDWMALNKYAALTYVPETDQSRLEGAGAGLNDND